MSTSGGTGGAVLGVVPSGGDDLPAVTAALASLAGDGGGTVRLAPGTFRLSGPLVWDDGNVHLEGSGFGSVLQAADAMSSVLAVRVGDGGSGRFADLVVDGNGLATTGIDQSIPVETSVGTSFERVLARNAAAGGYQWTNVGCEDCSYTDCVTPGDESDAGSIPYAINISVPDGAVTIRGGRLFGRVNVLGQMVSFYGTILGPLVTNNTTSAENQSVTLNGCYLYDSPVYNCVDTVTNLVNLNVVGTQLVSRSNSAFINGNIPADVELYLAGNQYVYVPGTAGDVYAVQASGAGYVTLVNSVPLVGSATWNHFNPVAGATTVVTNLAGQ